MFESRDRWQAIAISAGALLVAAVHMVRPQLTIDSVTLLLIGLAALPWLAPIIKKVTLPGGMEIELRQVKERLDQVSTRVGAIERVVFSGAITEPQQHRLETALEKFSHYLTELGFSSPTPLPTVHVKGSEGNEFDPETREIVLGKSCADDPAFLFREFAHYVLLAPLGPAVGSPWNLSFYRLESGMALYFACSFTGEVRFGGPAVARIFGMDTPYVANLDNQLRLDDVPKDDAPRGSIVAGQVWGAAFWSVRDQAGQAKADRVVSQAWLSSVRPGADGNWTESFTTRLLDIVAAQAGAKLQQELQQNLTRRGLSV